MQLGPISSPSASPVRSARPAGARPAPVGAPAAVTAVNPEAQRLAERPSAPEPAARRPQPPSILQAMFDQMGGTADSVWKGMHVNVVV
jgi:hypothetical protein